MVFLVGSINFLSKPNLFFIKKGKLTRKKAEKNRLSKFALTKGLARLKKPVLGNRVVCFCFTK